MIELVISYLVSVVAFYAQYLGQILVEAFCRGLSQHIFHSKKRRRPVAAGERSSFLMTGQAKKHNGVIKVSSVVAAMNARSVRLEVSFGEGFNHYRTALAWVEKARPGKPLPTVTFVLTPPDSYQEADSYLVQVPDEQLADFEAVEDGKNFYRLTSVLYAEECEWEEEVG